MGVAAKAAPDVGKGPAMDPSSWESPRSQGAPRWQDERPGRLDEGATGVRPRQVVRPAASAACARTMSWSAQEREQARQAAERQEEEEEEEERAFVRAERAKRREEAQQGLRTVPRPQGGTRAPDSPRSQDRSDHKATPDEGNGLAANGIGVGGDTRAEQMCECAACKWSEPLGPALKTARIPRLCSGLRDPSDMIGEHWGGRVVPPKTVGSLRQVS